MFDEVLLPAGTSYGASGGAGHNTAITDLPESGHEERVSRWGGAGRHQYSITKSKRSPAELSELKRFFVARRGSARGFRFRDPFDHSSAEDGTENPGTKDVQIGTGDGATSQFQLIKRYVSGLSTVVRNIHKPVEESVRIWVDKAELTRDTDFTVDDTTGVVTFMSAPSKGAPIFASFEFHVPVRAGTEVDELLATRWEDVEDGSAAITLVEILNPSPGATDFPYGGVQRQQMNADIQIAPNKAHLWVLDPQTSGLSAILPSPDGIPTGDNIVTVANEGANAIDLKDHEGGTLLSIAAAHAAKVCLVEDDDENLTWYAY